MDIFFTNRDELTKVPIDDVMYIRADGNYAIVCLNSGRTLSLLTSLRGIRQLLERIAPTIFVQIGRSHIVNIRYVSQVHVQHKTILVADDDTKVHAMLHVSKDGISHLLNTMKKTGTVVESFKTKNGNMTAAVVGDS